MTASQPATKPAAKKTQIVTIGGRRVKLTSDGRTTTAKPAPELEWRLQAAAVSALRNLDGYDATWTFAGDFNAGKRNAAKAKATGLTPGEADLRVYLTGGRILHIELKAAKTPVSADQVKRHALLRSLGHRVEIVRAASADEMARLVCGLVVGAM